jgi:hypothetical protein
MVSPRLGPRMKQGRHFPGKRVSRILLRVFVPVATLARKSQVILGRATPAERGMICSTENGWGE